MSENASGRTNNRTMRELANDDRPREKLLRHGAEVLSDAELIAIVLGSGMPGENVLELARRLLDTSLGLSGLVRADPMGLQRTRGLGPAKAAQVAAAIELGRRVGQLDADARPVMLTPEQVFAFLGPRLAGLAQERLYVLSLDSRGRLLGSSVAIEGTINAVSFRNAEVFREAVVLRATSIILAHNHPSGDARPSPQDVSSTKSAFAAGAALDIALLDHVIIGQGRFYSLKREGQGFDRIK
jgi:DNA repair protein RadC